MFLLAGTKIHWKRRHTEQMTRNKENKNRKKSLQHKNNNNTENNQQQKIRFSINVVQSNNMRWEYVCVQK